MLQPYRFYSKAAIERRADGLLRQMHDRGSTPQWPFDATLVADFLDLGVVWDRIEDDGEGAIAARILPLQRTIEINEAILDKPQGFQESTLAHEIGHWMLHVDVDFLERADRNEASASPFICRGNITKGRAASIEWQAQFFAGCLLMPRHVLEQKRRDRDITQWQYLYEIRDELGVSISNLVNRLQELGWIYIPKGRREIYPGPAIPYRS